MTQWLIEEALLVRLEAEEAAAREREEALAEAHRKAQQALEVMG